jgi:predicted nucleotidyltransferase
MDREELLAYIRHFLSAVKAEEGYLFGSRARGDHLENSDVDLIIISDSFQGVKFPWRLVGLQKHWDLPYFLEALPYTRAEAQSLVATSGVVAEALKTGIRVLPQKARRAHISSSPMESVCKQS